MECASCSILDIFMRRCQAILALLFLAQTALSGAEKRYQTGVITGIEQKVNTRILYYQVDTPITKDEPYYEVSVQIKDVIYLGRYIPRHADDGLPAEWSVGSSVEARVDEHHLFLKRPSG